MLLSVVFLATGCVSQCGVPARLGCVDVDPLRPFCVFFVAYNCAPLAFSAGIWFCVGVCVASATVFGWCRRYVGRV